LESAGTSAQLRQALEGLGYTSAEIRDVSGTIDFQAPVADQIRAALQALSRK
jgi:Holliday junction resolvasome RuvABC DNA-binding subunit